MLTSRLPELATYLIDAPPTYHSKNVKLALRVFSANVLVRHFKLHDGLEQRMCQARPMFGIPKVDQENLRCCRFGFGLFVTRIACRHVGWRRNIDLAAVSNAQFFIRI